MWNDRWLGFPDLIVAREEINFAGAGGSLIGSHLDQEAMEYPAVTIMIFAPQAMISIIAPGITALRAGFWDQLLDWFENATGDTRIAIAALIASSEARALIRGPASC